MSPMASKLDVVKTKNEWRLYRACEILPGVLAWLTFLILIIGSYATPIAMSFFIIAFDLYWMFKSVFFATHLLTSYRKMQAHMKIDWMKKIQEIPPSDFQISTGEWRDLRHLIILPTYREPYEILRGSFDSILHSSWPREKMIIVLALEENGGSEDAEIAKRIQTEYGNYFGHFLITTHPKNISGEIVGKGSNEVWAAKEAKKLIDTEGILYEHVIVSSLDADTRVYPDYFAIVAYHYLTELDSLHASFQPVPLYNNNIWEAPFFSRVVSFSSTFWQMMQQMRPEQLVTFSSHSMPFKSLVEIGFWSVDVVSEDSHIFWQALLHYNGNWRVVPLYYPVSMDANIGQGLLVTAKNVYRQQRRWAWGAENIAYIVLGFLKGINISFSKKCVYIVRQIEGFWSWSTNPIILFSLGWLPGLLGGVAFNASVLSYNLPRLTQIIMTISMVGLLSSALVTLLLLPPRPKHLAKIPRVWMFIQWFIVPLNIIILGSIPAIDAHTRLMLGKSLGFWPTPKFRDIYPVK